MIWKKNEKHEILLGIESYTFKTGSLRESPWGKFSSSTTRWANRIGNSWCKNWAARRSVLSVGVTPWAIINCRNSLNDKEYTKVPFYCLKWRKFSEKRKRIRGGRRTKNITNLGEKEFRTRIISDQSIRGLRSIYLQTDTCPFLFSKMINLKTRYKLASCDWKIFQKKQKIYFWHNIRRFCFRKSTYHIPCLCSSHEQRILSPSRNKMGPKKGFNALNKLPKLLLKGKLND